MTRRLTFDLDLDAAQAVLAGLGEPRRALKVSRLHGGSTEVYRIDLADRCDPLVLKVYPDEPSWTPAKEALVATWAGGEIDILTPKWLRLDETREILPLRYAVMTWVPGEPVRSFMTDPDVDAAYRQMGALLRRVHSIPMTAYGYILADGISRPRATNAEYMAQAFEQVFRRFRSKGGEPDLAERLEAIVRERFDVFATSAGPVLCHDDFHQGNVLASRSGTGDLQLTGLIDFGNAGAGDALFDLAKALFCSAHEDPASREPLLAGYGEIDHPDPPSALWLYTLFHRVTMWSWLVGLGDDPNAASGPGGLLHDLRAMAR